MWSLIYICFYTLYKRERRSSVLFEMWLKLTEELRRKKNMMKTNK